MTRFLTILAVLSTSLAIVQTASAQSSLYTGSLLNTLALRNSAGQYSSQQLRSNLYNSSIPRYAFSNANRGLFNSALTGKPMGGRAGGKPFSNAGGGSSVSPWLSLSDPFASTAHSYYTQVRPQLDQQRMNQQLASRNLAMQRQLNSAAAQGPYDPSGSNVMAPTGHGAAYMNYGGYYQPVQPTKQTR